MNHICTFLSSSNRILWDISLNIAEFKVVACIEHTTVSITTVVDKTSVKSVFFRGSNEHLRSVKVLGKKCLRNFRTEVSKVNNKSVASGFLDILKSLYHMYFAFYDTYRTFVNILSIIFVCVSLYKILSSCY